MTEGCASLVNPNGHTFADQLHNRPLIKALATRNLHSASSVDQLPKHISCGLLCGDQLAIAAPDTIAPSCWGSSAEPAGPNGILMAAPDLPGRHRSGRGSML